MGESSDDHDVDVEIRDEEMSSSSKLGDTTTTLSLQVKNCEKSSHSKPKDPSAVMPSYGRPRL